MLDFSIRVIVIAILVLLIASDLAIMFLFSVLTKEIRKRKELESIVKEFDANLKAIQDNYTEDVDRLTESIYSDTEDEVEDLSDIFDDD